MRFLIRLILIALVAVCVAIGGLLLLPGDRIARIAATQISKQTGRAVDISPDSSISLYPTLGITTGRAVIGSNDWAEEGPLLETDSLAIGIDVPALLTGTIRVSKLEAVSPRITLEKDADGRANWELFPSSEAVVTDTSQPALSDAATNEDGYAFSLEKAVIKNATLRYVDRQSGTVQAFENVDLDVSWPGAGSAAVIALGASPFGERIDIEATVGDVLGIARGAATPLNGTLTTGEAELTFAGSASIAPSAAMQITLEAPDAGQLLRAAGQTPEALGLAPDFAPNLSMTSNVTFDGTRATLRAMLVTLNGSSLAGDADVTLGDNLQITAQLKADVEDAGALMRLAGQAPESLGLDPAFNPKVSSNIALQMSGADVSARMTSLSATLENATLTGDVNARLSGGVPNVDATVAVKAPDVARVAALVGQPLTAFGMSEEATPAFSGDVAATVSGATLTSNITNLDAALGGATFTGNMGLTINGSSPELSGIINATVPDAAELARLTGQPLTNFGLSTSAAPSFAASVGLNMKGETFSADMRDLKASLDGASLASNQFYVALENGAVSASGPIQASVPSTAGLMQSLGLPAADIPAGFGRAITASTALNYSGNTLALSDLSAQLDQNAISGSASIALGGAVPNINASLAAGALDLTALSGGSDESAPSAGSGWSTDAIDASALGLINGNIALTASSVDLGTVKFGGTNVGIAIDNSRALISINQLQAYQGNFAGQFVANNRNGLSVSAKLNVASVALKPLLTALAGIDKIDGNANANVDVLGVGSSVDAIMKSLSGAISMSVPAGTIAGIDMDGLMRNGNPNASLTPFTGLQASGAIQSGVLSNSDLTAVTGRVDVTGDGQINLGGQSIDYVVTPVVKEVGDKERVSIPIRLRGPWSNISIIPDLERALQLEAERELKKLEEEARQRVEAEKEKLRQQAEAEKEKLRQQAAEEARKLEERARQKAEEAARKAAEKLKLDQDAARRLEDAAKKAIGNELNKGLRGLLGGN
ncbi:MAG: AsmA family protein [Pseudomonadota bacterium]